MEVSKIILKSRTESAELLSMRSLNARKDLTVSEKFHYQNLEKGYEGEMKFDQLTESLLKECFIINDLLLEFNHSYFQLDSIVISQNTINLIDVKNFSGDYYLESENLFNVSSHREYNNPIIQLKRSSALFRQLLQSLKFNFFVDSSIIFINPEFTLYQAPMDQPIILPTQVNRFLKDLSALPSEMNESHRQLAKKLISLHQTKNPHSFVPKYPIEQLRKGVMCPRCYCLTQTIEGKKCKCSKCGHVESLNSAVLKSVNEFKLLFPDQKVTTNIMYDFCKIISKDTLGKILRRNFKILGSHQWTYYE